MRRGPATTRWCGLLLAITILVGCAGTQVATLFDPEARLRARVAQYWDARVRGDIVETYQLHEPAFRRAVTLTAFVQGRGATTVLDHAIAGQGIQGDLAVVRMKVMASFRHPKMIRPVKPKWKEFEEQWVRVDGDWYRKFRFPVGDPYPPVNWDEVAAGRQAVRSATPTDRRGPLDDDSSTH